MIFLFQLAFLLHRLDIKRTQSFVGREERMEEAKSITDKHSREPKKTIGHSYGTGPPRYMGMIELV